MPQVLLQAVKQDSTPAGLLGVAVGLGLQQVPHAKVRLYAHVVGLEDTPTRAGHCECADVTQ